MQFEGYSKDDYDMYGSIIWKFLTMQLLLIVLLQSEKQSQDLGYQDGFDQLEGKRHGDQRPQGLRILSNQSQLLWGN